jgi:hypothetical protein
MSVVQSTAQVCNVCKEAIDVGMMDGHLGPVCVPCKTRLRFAHYWLTKDMTKVDFCSNKFNYRQQTKK